MRGRTLIEAELAEIEICRERERIQFQIYICVAERAFNHCYRTAEPTKIPFSINLLPEKGIVFVNGQQELSCQVSSLQRAAASPSS